MKRCNERVTGMARSIFSMRLTALRKEQHLTQEDVAVYLGLSRSTYTCYEVGTSMPSAQNLCAIADLFSVNLDYLLGRGEDPEMYDIHNPARTAQEIALMDRFRHISDKGRDTIVDMARLLDPR